MYFTFTSHMSGYCFHVFPFSNLHQISTFWDLSKKKPFLCSYLSVQSFLLMLSLLLKFLYTPTSRYCVARSCPGFRLDCFRHPPPRLLTPISIVHRLASQYLIRFKLDFYSARYCVCKQTIGNRLTGTHSVLRSPSLILSLELFFDFRPSFAPLPQQSEIFMWD